METQNLKPLNEYTPAELKMALKLKEDPKFNDREAYKALVAENIPNAMHTLVEASQNLTLAKSIVFDFFRDIMKLKHKVYGVKEKQQGHTFTNDQYSIVIGYRQTDDWDDTCTAGVQKVNNFIQSLATDEKTAKLVDTINRLLNRDKNGNLKANRVMELQTLAEKFNDEEFTDGVRIIRDSYKPKRSCWYIEAYEIQKDGSKTSLPLSMSAVPFIKDFDFDFFDEILKPEVNDNNSQ